MRVLILLQDKYNIGILTVNIELMWLGTKQMERFAKAHLSPVSKPRHINSIFTFNTPILYIYPALVLFEQANCIDWINFFYILSLTEILLFLVPLPHVTC